MGDCNLQGGGFVWGFRRSSKVIPNDRSPPVAYQVILEPGLLGQFRELEPLRVRIRINSLGLFLVHTQIDLRKARERELATLGEKSTSSGIAEPYAR